MGTFNRCSQTFLIINLTEIGINAMKTKSFYSLIITLLLLFGASSLKAQQSLLYEDFNSSTSLPTTWDNTETSTTVWKIEKTNGYEGYSAYFNSYSAAAGNSSVFKTPLLTFTSDKMFSFVFKNAKGGDFSIYVDVYEADGVNYTRHLLESGLKADDWTTKTYSLKDYTNKNIRISFSGTSNKAKDLGAANKYEGYILLDKVVVEDVSICAYPTKIELVSVLQNSASVQWQLDAEGGSVPTNFRLTLTDSQGAVVGDYNDYLFENDGSYFFTLEGLSSNSVYKLKLRSDCSEDSKGISKWSDEFEFSTLCEPATLPFVEDFNADSRVLSSCWMVGADNPSGVSISLSGFQYGDTGYALELKGNASSATQVVSQQIAHASNNLEVSFMVRGDYGLPFSVGVTPDPLAADAFQTLWEDTIDFNTGWREVRFCTDASYYEDQTNMSVFVLLPAGVSGSTRLYIDDFKVVERPTCPRLEKVRVSNIMARTLDLTWLEFGKANNYEVEISGLGNTKTQTFTSQPATVTGLEGNTYYSIRVRSICSASDRGEWSQPLNVTTSCDVMESNVFQQGFEASSSTIPECWQVRQFVAGYGDGDNHGDQGIDVYTPTFSYYPDNIIVNEAKEGNKVLRFRKSKGGTHTALITQPMQIDVEGSYDVSFWMYRHVREVMVNGDRYSEPIRVWVNTRPDTIGAVLLDEINAYMLHAPQVEQPGFYQYDYNIPLAGTVYFMLEAIAAPQGNDLYVDDIRVYPAPTCRKIKDIEMLPTTKTEFGMKWAKGKDESEWIVKYRLTDPNSGATIQHSEKHITGGTPEFKLEGLTHSTEYRIAGKVASYCGVGDTSVWVDFDYRFMTQCAPVHELPFEENFEGQTFPPVCWSMTVPEGTIERHERAEFQYEGAGVMFEVPGNGQALVTPQISFSAGHEYRLTFMMMRNFGDGGIKVMLNDVPSTEGAQQLLYVPTDYLQEPKVTKKGYYQYKVDFDAVGDKYILFVQTSTEYTSANDYIDNVVISEKPACESITTFDVRNISSYSAQLVVSDDDVYACEVSLCKEGVSANDGLKFTSDTTVVDLTNLDAETTYNVYVRSVCSGNVYGEWSTANYAFTTFCTPFAISKTTPFTESFEDFTDASQLGGCYLREDGYFRVTKEDLSTKHYQSMNHANTGELYAWINGTIATMFRPVRLKAGVYYEISAYAIQAGTSSHLSLGVGKYAVKDSMSFVLLEETIEESWNKHAAYFAVPEDGIYFFGINVYAGNSVGLDDISIQEINCVPAPTGIANLTSTSAAIKITDMSAGRWVLSVNDFEFVPETSRGNVLYDTVTAEYTDLANLMPNKTYYYAIKSLCDDEHSSWSEIRTFRTRCSAVSVPFTESFEYGYDCWTFLGDNQYVNTNSSQKVSGNLGLSVTKATIISPELDVTGLADYMITGWVRSNIGDVDLSIGVMTDPADVSTFEPIGTYHIQDGWKWYQFRMYFNDLLLDDYVDFRSARYVAIYLPQEDVSFFIDDVVITLAPQCKQPVEAKIDAVTSNSATLSWTSKSDETSWNVVARIGERVMVDTVVTSNPATITGLRHSTTYDFLLKALCSDTTESEVTEVGRATTECGWWSLPYVEEFEGYAYGSLPLCWTDGEGATADSKNNWRIEYSRLYFESVNYYNTKGNSAAILSPIIDLTNEEGARLHIDLMNKYADTITIRLSTDGGQTFPIVLGQGYTNLMNYTRYSFDLTPYVGNPIRVSITGKSSGAEGSFAAINRFEIEKIESCMRPVSLAMQSISGTSATIQITDTTSATAWQYVCLRQDEYLDTVTVFTDVTTNPFTIHNLSGFTQYHLYVRTNCGTAQSSWRDIEFMTECADVNSVPYVESFEHIDNVNQGCYTIFSTKPEGWRPAAGISLSKFSDGAQSMEFFPSATYPLFVIMPVLDVPTTSLQLSFDYLSNSSSYYAPDIVVGVMTDPEDASSFVEVETFVPFSPEKDANDRYIFSSGVVSFNILEAEYASARIAFKVGPTLYDSGDACIDNVVIRKITGCPNVRSLSLVESASSTASVAVQYQSPAVQLAYGPATQDIDSMPRILSMLDTIVLPDLAPATNYVVYARSVCGADTGDWVQPLLFGTECPAFVIDDQNPSYTESFNSLGDHPYAFPACYTRLEPVHELGVEYPCIKRVNASEGDRQVLTLYKDAAVALPVFNLTGEKLTITFNSYSPSGTTYYNIGLQDDLSDPTTFHSVRELYTKSNLISQSIDFSTYNVSGKYIVFRGQSNTKMLYIDNIFITRSPECFAPSDLAIEVYADTFAVATWNHAPAATAYEYTLSSDTIVHGTIDPTVPKLQLADLTPATQYVLRMRAVCGVDSTEWCEVNFRTLRSLPAVPYDCGFEDADENAGWNLVNTRANARFTIGASNNNSVLTGDSALYVSDTQGNYGYYESGSANIYAYRTFLFNPGDYQLTFDWKSNGESERDFGRVFLAPTDVTISTESKLGPDKLDTTRYIRLHSTDKLSGSPVWSKSTTIFSVNHPVNYHLIVQWSNDGSGATLPPLAIDNIQIKPVECGVIESLTLVDLGTTEAVFALTNPVEGGTVEYYLSSLADGSDTLALGTVVADTIRLSGLTADTQYYLCARPQCDAEVTSPFTTLGFATLCEPIAVSLQSPYVANFDDYLTASSLDNCWSEEHRRGSNSWLTNVVDVSFADAKPHSGTNYISLSGRGGANTNALTRRFTLAAQTYYRISVYARQSDVTAAHVSILAGEPGATSALVRREVYNTDYQKITAEFFAPTSGTYELGFMAEISGSSWNIIADDFMVEALVVGTPVNLAVDAVTTTSASFSWLGNSAVYQLQVLSAGIVVADVNASQPQTTVAGLQPSTVYTARVRAVYGTEVSDWASILFNTECGTVRPPFVQDFEAVAPASIPYCWDNTSRTSLLESIYNCTVVQPSDYSNIGTDNGRCVQIQCASTQGHATLLTPEMQLDGDYTLSFDYWNNSPIEQLALLVVTPSRTDTLALYGNTDELWQSARHALSAYSGQSVRIGFHSTSAKASSAQIAVDNIRVICYVDDLHFTDAICQPAQGSVTYERHGFSVNSSSLVVGTNVITRLFEAQSADQCDTLKTLHLTMHPSGVYQYNDTICEGEVYNRGAFAGKGLVIPGYYDAQLVSSCGCDSVVRLHLVVLPATTAVEATICEGETYTLGSRSLTEAGIYRDTLVNSRGCDSIITLTLNVVQRYYLQSQIACEGTQYSWLDTILTTTGRYERVYPSLTGCDSVVAIQFTVLPSVVEAYDTICLGEQYIFNDTILTEAGFYTRTFQNILRCDSTVHLHLHVSEPEPTIERDYVCEGELYSGYGHSRITITQDTMLVQRFSYPDRCDSLVHIYVEYIERIQVDTTIHLAYGDVYEFGEQTLSKAGTYREVFTSVAGCDSIVNLTLTVGTGVVNVEAMQLIISPNPVQVGEVAYIQFDSEFSILNSEFSILNSLGQTIYSGTPTSHPIAIHAILPRGIYIIRLTTHDGIIHQGKLIVN